MFTSAYFSTWLITDPIFLPLLFTDRTYRFEYFEGNCYSVIGSQHLKAGFSILVECTYFSSNEFWVHSLANAGRRRVVTFRLPGDVTKEWNYMEHFCKKFSRLLFIGIKIPHMFTSSVNLLVYMVGIFKR